MWGIQYGKEPFFEKGGLILAIAGRIGAGKTTVASYLVQHHIFQRLSYRVMLSDIYWASKNQVREPDRRDLQDLGISLTNLISHSGLTAILLRGLRGNRIVVDGIRHYNGYKFLEQNYGPIARLIYQDLPIHMRYRLYNERLAPDSSISPQEFQKMDKHPSEADIEKLKVHADFLLPYFEDIRQLYQAIDLIVSGWKS